MSDALKNRLIGTIILVALAVILLPEFLDGQKQKSEQAFVEMPEPAEDLAIPALSQVDLTAIKDNTAVPQQRENLQASDALYEAAQTGTDINTDNQLDDKSVIETSTPNDQATALENAVEGTAWVIQLGSFGNRENVQKLLQSVTDAGFNAYTQPVSSGSNTLTKVFVGPELDREILERALTKLKDITGLTGKITEYDVSAN